MMLAFCTDSMCQQKPRRKGTPEPITIGEDDTRERELANMRRKKQELADRARRLASSAATRQNSVEYAREYVMFMTELGEQVSSIWWKQTENIEITTPPEPTREALQALQRERSPEPKRQEGERLRLEARRQDSDATAPAGLRGGPFVPPQQTTRPAEQLRLPPGATPFAAPKTTPVPDFHPDAFRSVEDAFPESPLDKQFSPGTQE